MLLDVNDDIAAASAATDGDGYYIVMLYLFYI